MKVGIVGGSIAGCCVAIHVKRRGGNSTWRTNEKKRMRILLTLGKTNEAEIIRVGKMSISFPENFNYHAD